MDDLKQTKQTEPTAAKTQELPAIVLPSAEDDEQFRAAQGRIEEMIAANAPLSEILSRLVLLIEAQSPEMLCSVLLISDDGNHIKHVVAPSLPEHYVRQSTVTRLGRSMARAGRLCSVVSQ